MDLSKYNNSVIIVKDNYKLTLLKILSKSLLNIKIITLTELKNKYLFAYDNQSVFYICQKYNVIPSIAKIYLDNLYYLNDQVIDNQKIKFLKEIKQELLDQNLLIVDPNFKKYIKLKKVYTYNLQYVNKFYQSIFNDIKAESIEEKYSFKVKNIYQAQTIEEEVAFVASKICSLIKEGIDINRIKLTNIKDNYRYIIHKTFKLFNIPVLLRSSTSLKGTRLIKIFKEEYNDDIKLTLEKVFSKVNTEKDKNLYNQIIKVVNNYNFIDNYNLVKEQVFLDLENLKVQEDVCKNVVLEVDFDSTLPDDYIFLMNFNEGSFPIYKKDEEYLSDELKTKLNISTSKEENYLTDLNIKNKLNSLDNLFITYSLHSDSTEAYISNLYNEDEYKLNTIIDVYTNSNQYNRLRLLSFLDLNAKYGTYSQDLLLLHSHYKDFNYLTYSNIYKEIRSDIVKSYLNNKLTLSYTSLSTFYLCQFKYYLDYVLKLDEFKDTFDTIVGTIFHNVLAKSFSKDNNITELFNSEISKYSFTNSETFFINLLKEEIVFIVEEIKNQLKYSSLTKSLFEEKFEIILGEDKNIIFKGFIDKLLYDTFDGNDVVTIIDYKTGSPSLNIKNIKYGLDMQLPIYAYLVKKSNRFKNVKIGGFYLQKILKPTKDESEKKSSLKLQGYSNEDLKILALVDSSYNDSHVIKSMKTTSKGFYQYAKVLNDDQIDDLINQVDENIKVASDAILNGKFTINPKELNGKVISCSYCIYKDICYKTFKDNVKLEGDLNGQMD